MTYFDPFKDFDKFFVGYDDYVNRMTQLQAAAAKVVPNYPPYNIKKIDDTHYVIEMAVAGFGSQEIDIEIDGDKLVIKGNVNSTEPSDGYIFKGIANRAFTRTFMLNDRIEVENAELFNGMLKVFLERIIPEENKPKKVVVKDKSAKQFLVE